jgi:hypothetical protein
VSSKVSYKVSSKVSSGSVLQGILWGVLQGCPPPGVSSKVSSREDTLPILFIYRKLYSLNMMSIPNPFLKSYTFYLLIN